MRAIKLFLLCLSPALFFLPGCKKHEDPNIPIQFESAAVSLQEGKFGVAINMKVGTAMVVEKHIKVKIESSSTNGIDKDYSLSQHPNSNGEITVSVPANVTSFKAIEINTYHDGLVESDETITFTISSLDDALSFGENNSLTVTIVDDPSVGFKETNFTIDEGQKNVPISFESTSALPTGDMIKVSVSPLNGLVLGNGKDLLIDPLPISNVISIPSGSLNPSFLISSFLDAHPDLGQGVTFGIVSAPVGFNIGAKNSITVTITDSSLGSGIVGEYLFNGNAFDTSGKGHNGTVTGATLTTSKTGEANTAYYFNGPGQYIQVGNNTDINFAQGQDFSVSLWVSTSEVQNDLGGSINNIMRQWVGDAQGFPYSIGYLNSTHPTDPQKFIAGRYDGSACGHIPDVRSGLVEFSFQHLVFRKSGTTLFLYVDNVLVSQGNDFTTCATTNISSLFIGCYGGTRCFTGKIDDIRIYNRALADAEIGLLFNL